MVLIFFIERKNYSEDVNDFSDETDTTNYSEEDGDEDEVIPGMYPKLKTPPYQYFLKL